MSQLPERLAPVDHAIGLHEKAGRGRAMRVDLRRRAFVAGLPLQESESVQLGAGDAEYVSRRVCGRDLVLLSYRVAPELSVHSVPQRDWVVLIMAMNPRSEFFVNGRETRAWDLVLSAGRDGYMTVGKDRRNLAVAVRRQRLVQACAALGGLAPEDIRLRDCVLLPGQDLGQRLRRGLICAATPPDVAPTSAGTCSMPMAVENDSLSMLAAQLLPALRRTPEARTREQDALRVVHAAASAMKELPAPSLAEMCAAAGVSQRWLHKCFVDVVGVSPYRYVRLARLSKAREQLLAADAETALIKTLSLSLGYRLSGRFAAEYRSVFGENPSDTLRSRYTD